MSCEPNSEKYNVQLDKLPTELIDCSCTNSNDIKDSKIDFQEIYNQKDQRFSKISLMLEFDIDNTLNSFKETKTCACINYLESHLSVSKLSSPSFRQPSDEESEELNNISTLYTIPKSKSISNSCVRSNAKRRWNILARVLRKGSLENESILPNDEEAASVRRFKSFDLLHQNNFEDYSSLKLIGRPENWYTYKINLNGKEFLANIHHVNQHLTASDLMGYNNTGNICIWPSEEALTVYVLSNLDIFHGKWILELGGGMTCLSGVLLAKYGKPYVVHLTDGNTLSVENVRKTICLNVFSCYTKCSVLKWENVRGRLQTENEKFDFILSADCLFFDDARSDLIETIWFYLSPNGVALVVAPERGNTMSSFVEECSIKGFHCQKINRYNDIIWQKHLDLQKLSLYNEDIHYPILIKLTKSN